MEEQAHKDAFCQKLAAIALDTNGMFVMTNDQRREILQQLKAAKGKSATQRTRCDYRKLKRYDILTLGDDKLIKKPKRANDTEFKYVASVEELYDIIHAKHVELQHSGRDRMLKELKKRYYNVTREAITLFLTYCSTCQLKKRQARKGLVVRPIVSNELNSRCQIDLIDMQSQAIITNGRTYRHILVYQDHLTKFIQLRALENKTANEVAYHLKHIFAIFGAPHILQSDNGKEFVAGIITELVNQWAGCKLVHGRPRHSQSQGSVERANQDIQDMIFAWIRDHNDSDWTKALPEVQFAKNRTLHRGIQRTPYMAMFGTEPRLGLSTSRLPIDMIGTLSTEEDFEEAWSRVTTGAADNAQEDMQCYADTEPDSEDIEHNSDVSNDSELYDESNGFRLAFVESPSSRSITNEDSGSTYRTLQQMTHSPLPHCCVCEQQYSGSHTCRTCNRPCHTICGVTNASDESYTGKVLCHHCARQESALFQRKEAKRMQEQQAEKMFQASNKRFKPAAVGDNVVVGVPDVDRGRTDARNVMAVVVSEADGFYTLGTKHGILNRKYVRTQFTPCAESFITPAEIPDTEISLRQAAGKTSLTGGQGYSRCNCKKNCQTNACSCRKASKMCTSKCHGSLSCCNK